MMPAEKLRMLKAIAEALQNVRKMVAVVLGGSYARGFARPDSDIDIGLYYREATPFAVDQVRSVAEDLHGRIGRDRHGNVRVGTVGERRQKKREMQSRIFATFFL